MWDKVLQAFVYIVAAAVAIIVVFLLAGADGPRCYVDGCEHEGEHQVRVCDHHKREKLDAR